MRGDEHGMHMQGCVDQSHVIHMQGGVDPVDVKGRGESPRELGLQPGHIPQAYAGEDHDVHARRSVRPACNHYRVARTRTVPLRGPHRAETWEEVLLQLWRRGMGPKKCCSTALGMRCGLKRCCVGV
jgi:hypothetical protein